MMEKKNGSYPLSLSLYDSDLKSRIRSLANDRIESRQVYRRKKDLLPRYARQIPSPAGGRQTQAAKKRAILLSDAYLKEIDSIVELYAFWQASRIEYETHWMLLDARASKRAFSL